MNLWDTPAGFDQPLEALWACHRRIEKQTATLIRLQKHVARSGFDNDARIAATGILRYFVEAAPHHHADEENDLFPRVLRAAQASADRAQAFALVSRLLVEHRNMEDIWEKLHDALRGLLSGEKTHLDGQLCKEFTRIYSSHMEREDKLLFPLAARLLSQSQLQALGTAMAQRRGLPPPVFSA